VNDYPLTYWAAEPADRKGMRCRVVKYSRFDGFVNAGNYREVTFEFTDGVQLVAPQKNAQRRPQTIKRAAVETTTNERERP
jgi:hypothetical protein